MATQILAKRISDWAPIEIIVQSLDDIQCICGMVNQEDKESFVLEIVSGSEVEIVEKLHEIIQEKVNKEFGIKVDYNYSNILSLTN